jgi:hypothetical protein
MRCSRVWLCLPPGILVLLDGVLTLQGQPSRYWAGDFALRRELNPVIDLLLAWHPGAFLLAWAAWSLLIVSLIFFSPVRIAFLVALVGTIGHVCGAASWLVESNIGGWVAAIGLLLTADRAFWYAVRRSGCLHPT